MDQLADYRKKRQLEYEKKTRLKDIETKYKTLLILDPTKRANARIISYAKRHYFKQPVNIDQNIIDKIPGIYRFRCSIYIVDNSTSCSDEVDFSAPCTYTVHSDLQMSVLVDLRIYGSYPSLPLMINNVEYLLPQHEQEKIKDIWNKINPDNTNGLRFQQYIDYTKAMCRAYNKIK